MYRLTDRRLAKAEQLLEQYRSELVEHGRFNVTAMDHELKDLWNIGYQELKDVVVDMYKNHDRYKYVAVYYMEHSNDIGVAGEFKPILADAYGLKRYHDDDLDASRQRFWENATAELQGSAG